MATERSVNPPAGGNGPGVPTQRVRVDAGLLESALLNLRKRIAAVPLVFDLPEAGEVAAERTKLLGQIDDYLLPRVRQSAAPLLVALVGSTGAGKSTLINSVVGAQVSLTGVRRPTTNSPVLVCHPDDAQWFAEDMFLPTMPRVYQEGTPGAGRDGVLVVAVSEAMTKGIALLDTPDIDSVVHAHHDFAHQFLDTSDLWLFMTSASRYADAPGWELLRHAKERGAALGVILSRVPPRHRAELVEHFNAMLDANGVVTEHRFVIPEAGLADGFLPQDVVQPLQDWLGETAQHADRRVTVLTQTMSGMLDTFKTRVPQLAAHVDAQVMLRTWLRQEAENAYATALVAFDEGTCGGRLLAGEAATRWQDYVASGDLEAAARGRSGPSAMRRGGKRGRADTAASTTASRHVALEEALRAALEALVVSVADRAAEQVARSWRESPAGAALLSAAEEIRSRHERAKREFESTFGPVGAGAISATGQAREPETVRSESFTRSAPDLPLRVSRAVSAWEEQLTRQSDATKRRRSGAGRELTVLALVALVCEPARADAFVPAPREADQATSATAREALAAIVGDQESVALLARARHDLRQRIGLLFDEEMLRYGAVIEEAGEVDAVAAVRLYQAEHQVEAAR